MRAILLAPRSVFMIKNTLPETTLKTSDFYYDLPNELIAQTPLTPRDSSRLLALRGDGTIEDKHFYDILDYLNEGDTLVINDSRVIPARIFGDKVRTGEFESAPSKIETLLLKHRGNDEWVLKLMMQMKRI